MLWPKRILVLVSIMMKNGVQNCGNTNIPKALSSLWFFFRSMLCDFNGFDWLWSNPSPHFCLSAWCQSYPILSLLSLYMQNIDILIYSIHFQTLCPTPAFVVTEISTWPLTALAALAALATPTSSNSGFPHRSLRLLDAAPWECSIEVEALGKAVPTWPFLG